MSHLYLPAQHTDTDLALASAVAEAIDSNELYVAWTCDGGTVGAPKVKALLRRLPEPELRNPFVEALSEIGSAFRAFARFFSFRRRTDRPVDTNLPVRTSRSELEEAA
jgi:hypothetical protein